MVRLGGRLRWFCLAVKCHFYLDRMVHPYERYVLGHTEVAPIKREIRVDLPAPVTIAIESYLKRDRFGDAEQSQITLQLEFVGIARSSHAGGSERDSWIIIHREEPWSLDHFVLDAAAGCHAGSRDLGNAGRSNL